MLKIIVDIIRNYWFNWKLHRYLKQEEQILAGIRAVGPELRITKEHSLYLEALSKIKKAINAKATTKEQYEKVLQETQELSQYAIRYNNVNGLKMIENLKKAYVYKHEAPKEAMIDQRIKHYQELQAHTLKRQELRKKRKESKNGNV